MEKLHLPTLVSPIADDCDDEIYSFHLILLADYGELCDLWLPATPEGFFQFEGRAKYRFLSIVSRNGKWIAVCHSPAFFLDVPLEQSYEVILADNQLLKIECANRNFSLYAKKVCKSQMVYRNYSICTSNEISIGSLSGCDICCNNPTISSRHAVIKRLSDGWEIRDCNSAYGLFINGVKRKWGHLRTGDIVSIMNLKIIIGPGFLSINDSAGKVTVNQNITQDMMDLHHGYANYRGQPPANSADSFFNRSPRKRGDLPPKTISVEGPPMSMDQKQIPLMLRMGSSMVMGGAAAIAGNFMTLISSVMFPMLTSKFSEHQRQEYERLRISKYREYLANKAEEIENACLEEKVYLNNRYPTLRQVINIATQHTHLWERRPIDSDFLHIRLGTGTRPLATVIDYPAKRFSLERDKLEDEMYQLVEDPYYVEDAPIVLPLAETRVCGLLGDRKNILAYVRQLVLQTAVLHSYDEVKTVFFLSKDELPYLEEIRYLPHAWDDQRTIRFIATNESEAYKLGEYIGAQMAKDKDGEQELAKILKKRPYYLLFALNKKIFESYEGLKEILESEDRCGVSIIAAYPELPKEAQKIITLTDGQQGICTTMSADGGEDVLFNLDTCQNRDMAGAMRILANTRLKTNAPGQELPKMITFLEMYKVGRIEQLNPIKRWQESNPIKSLAAPVGVSADGSLFMLDLHEKHQGPHGLVAGTTGSGKSEFLITYILSLAINYHPDEVAFVLIDYKGGGLARAFENPETGVRLPHLAGTITNLDGASIQRSLMSIDSELVRRQRVFDEAKTLVNEGTMDIYDYQKLYRAGKVSKPMPHLFIISDEFAELKQQQPEFMDKLISAARIGRSLGVHLILATQKPSGVVNDQIRSNTKFRVCLRVQDRSDSMDMLKRPEAAELVDTGRFYLQVGYNEYFALGQSAWCGAVYEPQDAPTVRWDNAVEFLDITGQVIAKAAPKVRKTDSGKKQIVAIVEYLSELAKTHNIKPQQLWQPELPQLLDLEELQHKSPTDDPMTVCLGKVDDPENQRQFPLNLDFAHCQNLLIAGTAESGKSTIIQNILYSLSQQLTPKEFNFYVLDYSSRMIKLFKPLPHCGAIQHEEDSGSLDEFFKLVNGLVFERKKLFSELEIEGFEVARERIGLPLIVVVIDNIAALSGSRIGEKHMYQMASYMKDSYNYGVKFIVTCNGVNEVSGKIRQELGTRIALHLKDKYDYSEILGCRSSYVPPEIPGRGLCKCNDRALEFQGALIRKKPNDQERISCIKETVAALVKKYGSISDAQRMTVVKEDALYEEFAAQFRKSRIPLGYSKSSRKPVALPLKQFSLLSVYFGNPTGTVALMNNLLHAFARENMELWIIRKKKDSLFVEPEKKGILTERLSDADYMDCSVENMRTLQQALLGMMSHRKDVLEQYFEEHKIPQEQRNDSVFTASVLREQTRPILLLLENIGDFCASLNAFSTMNYCELFKRAQKYNIYVVACLEPDIPEKQTQNDLFIDFSNNNMLFFGGNLDKQALYHFSSEIMAATIPFNTALMIYRKSVYALTMPCGNMEKPKEDEDMMSIF